VKPLFEVYANLAGVDNQLGQQTKQASYYTEAEAASRQALALAPNNPQAWNNLAISLYYQGRGADARQALSQAAQIAPGDPQIQANLRALGVTR
jgi:Flp pilus assembly protein TadD